MSETTRPEKAELRSIVANACIATFGLVAGVVGTISLTDEVLIKYHGLVYAFLIVLVALAALVAVGDAMLQARGVLAEMEKTGAHLRDKVPLLVTFERRVETVTVSNDGDGIFESEHRVRYNGNDEHDITRLHFPILIDLQGGKDGEPGDNVLVESVQVDGLEEQVTGSYEPQERRQPMKATEGQEPVWQEYGVVRVPVELNRNKRIAEVHIRIKLKSIFKESAAGGDYVIIDIPYVTESLSIAVKAEDPKQAVRRRIANDSTIEATCEMMDLRDGIEESRQSPSIRLKSHQLRWETGTAKIGYRYRLWFHVSPRA
jgi:hypothetical protein